MDQEIFHRWCDLPIPIKCIVVAYTFDESWGHTEIFEHLHLFSSVCREFYSILRNRVTLLHLSENILLPIFVRRMTADNITACWNDIYVKDNSCLCSSDGTVIARTLRIFVTLWYIIKYTGEHELKIWCMRINDNEYEGGIDISYADARVLETEIGLVIHDWSDTIMLLNNGKLERLYFPPYSMAVCYDGIFHMNDDDYLSHEPWETVLERKSPSGQSVSEAVRKDSLVGDGAPIEVGLGKSYSITKKDQEYVLESLFARDESLFSRDESSRKSASKKLLVNNQLIVWDNLIIDHVTNKVVYQPKSEENIQIVGVVLGDIGYIVLCRPSES